MKSNFVFSFLVALSMALGVSAQQMVPMAAPFQKMPLKVHFGAKLGLDMTKLNSDSWNDGYKSNAHGGVFLAVMGWRWGIHAEAILSQRNFTTSRDFYELYHQYYNQISDSLRAGRFRLNYLSVPILFRLKVMKGIDLLAGPQWSGLLGASDKEKIVKNPELLFKNKEVSGVIGLWVKPNRNINIGMRYILGFSDNNNTNIQESWRTRGLHLHVGIGI